MTQKPSDMLLISSSAFAAFLNGEKDKSLMDGKIWKSHRPFAGTPRELADFLRFRPLKQGVSNGRLEQYVLDHLGKVKKKVVPVTPAMRWGI